ncbi:MAG TPA: SIR2 family protein [Solirubrobacterales bacterium]|nr:SIR2 family protein [Solirubrobacterales bacterium]
MNLLLVLGAGASRNLGKQKPMPLMPDWSNALCEALDRAEKGLADACGLEPGIDGPTFEKNLGLLLRWQGVRHLEQRFEGLGGPQPGGVLGSVREARANTQRRMETVMKVINSTLYDQFGQLRIDYDLAVTAYSQILAETEGSQLVIATTNYDRAAESALRMAGHSTNTGFSGKPHMTPALDPSGMMDNLEAEIPVIHLHGAVGWYELEGIVSDHYGDRPYNPTLGSPVVLYPDPEKDPTSDALVQQLWDQFAAAIELSDLILVIGHSLHDPALVGALSSAIADGTRVIVSYLDDEGGELIDRQLPNAHVVQMRFGPTIESTTAIRDLVSKHAGQPAG